MGYDETIQALSPTAFLLFEETSGTTAADWTTNYPFTYSSVTLNQTGPGTGKRGVLFASGSSSTTYRDTLVVSGSSALSMECWVKTTSNTVNQVLMSLAHNSSAQYLQLRLNGLNGVYFSAKNDANSNSGNNSTGGTVNNNTWNHVVATYSGTALKCYVNATQIGTTQTWTGGTITINRTGVGALRQSSSSNYLSGTIARPAFYNFELTSGQITSNYNAMTATSALKILTNIYEAT